MIADMMPGTEEQLQKELTSAYVGIDPTADSLHIGHLVSVRCYVISNVPVIVLSL